MEHSLIYGLFRKIGLFILENYEKSKLNTIGRSLSRNILNIRDNSIFVNLFFAEKKHIENSIFFKGYSLILKNINKILKTLNKLVKKNIINSIFYLSGKELKEDIKNKDKTELISYVVRESIPYRLINTIFTLEGEKKVGK